MKKLAIIPVLFLLGCERKTLPQNFVVYEDENVKVLSVLVRPNGDYMRYTAQELDERKIITIYKNLKTPVDKEF
jgi:hypothetical protein